MDFGAIVDLETTGLDPSQDKIIELGLIEFSVGTQIPPSITRCYSALEDPGIPLEPEVTEVTGLNDAVLKGQRVDWTLVRNILANVSVVIAHNAKFDRAFLQTRPELAELNLHWACSFEHIAWRQHGYRSQNLNYLAADHGFLNPFPHRALFDCATTFRLITPHIDELIERSYLRQFQIKATGSPFESKDKLRSRGYRWEPEERVWSRLIFEDDLEEERHFLKEQVYDGRARHQEIALP